MSVYESMKLFFLLCWGELSYPMSTVHIPSIPSLLTTTTMFLTIVQRLLPFEHNTTTSPSLPRIAISGRIKAKRWELLVIISWIASSHAAQFSSAVPACHHLIVESLLWDPRRVLGTSQWSWSTEMQDSPLEPSFSPSFLIDCPFVRCRDLHDVIFSSFSTYIGVALPTLLKWRSIHTGSRTLSISSHRKKQIIETNSKWVSFS